MLKSIEMKQELENLKNKAKDLLADNDAKLEDIQAVNTEIETLKAKITVQEQLEEEEKAKIEDKTPVKEPENNVITEFANAARSKFRNAMTSTAAEGGYTIPQDIQTKINELRQSQDALQKFITVESVSTPTGSRVFKARSQQTGFAEVTEGGTITEKATPQFTQLQYAVKKYAGFFPITNELLKDSDQAITGTLVNWIGNESRITRNKLILDVLGTKAKTALADVDAFKDVLNVQLDPAFRYTSVILTNQDGFNWLDKQKDQQGNYLLQPSVSSPTGKQLFGVPVVMVSNKDLPTVEAVDTTPAKAPVIIGDLKEAVVLFDREQMSIVASSEAGDSYLTDRTLFRAIEREVVKMRDEEAFVYGEVALS